MINKIKNIILVKELDKYLKDNFGDCRDFNFGCMTCQSKALVLSIKRFVDFCEDLERDDDNLLKDN
jgi:hypothetical protein